MRKTLDHGLTSAEVFKLVWTGWFWGAGSIFGVLFAVAALISRAPEGLVAVVVVPLIAAGQGAICGGVIAFGLWLYREVDSRRIRHNEEDTA